MFSFMESPRRLRRGSVSEWNKSSQSRPFTSANTVTASSKETLCFSKLVIALVISKVNIYYCIYTNYFDFTIKI